MLQEVRLIIQSETLPESRDDCLNALTEDTGRYTSQEGQYWDFKREWPFSYSDAYFGGIARQICGFANASGGLIIFGVHDSTRDAGHNKVNPNLDKLEKTLSQLLSEEVRLSLRRYETDSPDAVDVLLVHPLAANVLPVRFKRAIDKYAEGIIWVRQGHEIIQAEPRHVPLLYCRSDRGAEEILAEERIGGLLPPSPSNIRRFVGRLHTIDSIFAWLKRSDEPRTFLYGKGGSGKTTIAYQVARTIWMHGTKLAISEEDRLDNVIFVSAKEKALHTISGTQSAFVGLDFSTERELYEAILTLGNWTTTDLSALTLAHLKLELRQFLDLTSNLIVIDDIDTLTTKGIEAGFDALYGLLWRAKRRTKVLYTLRNAPSHSLANAIEVPGLSINGEYEEFVEVCCNQFRVKHPEKSLRDQQLAIISERRPLVIESIIALRKNCGDYDRALKLFEQNSGEDVRRYVFQREWDSLPPDNFGRYILAVLALYKEPLTFADLAALTRYDEGRVAGAVADVREMFLVINEVGAEPTYELGALTEAFISGAVVGLDKFAALKERVFKYKKNVYPENPNLSRIKFKVQNLLHRSYIEKDANKALQAWRLVMDGSLPVQITEDPRFLSLQGYVACRQIPPRIADGRGFFANVIAMKSEPDIEHLRGWYLAERDSGFGIDKCREIVTLVQNGTRYTEEEKVEFLGRKGVLLYNFGRDLRYNDPTRAVEIWLEALKAHLICFYVEIRSDNLRSGKPEEYSRNTCYSLLDSLVATSQKDEFLRVVNELRSTKLIYLDPIEDPLLRALNTFRMIRSNRSDLQRFRGKMELTFKGIEQPSYWLDPAAGARVLTGVEALKTALNERIKAAAAVTKP